MRYGYHQFQPNTSRHRIPFLYLDTCHVSENRRDAEKKRFIGKLEMIWHSLGLGRRIVITGIKEKASGDMIPLGKLLNSCEEGDVGR